jgi:hypothetical protein
MSLEADRARAYADAYVTGSVISFHAKRTLDYPTVNVRGNYISQEEADCYRSYLRPSTTRSVPLAGLARHKLHGQAGATARI